MKSHKKLKSWKPETSRSKKSKYVTGSTQVTETTPPSRFWKPQETLALEGFELGFFGVVAVAVEEPAHRSQHAYPTEEPGQPSHADVELEQAEGRKQIVPVVPGFSPTDRDQRQRL